MALPILVTRPEPAARRAAERIAARLGARAAVLVCPIVDIVRDASGLPRLGGGETVVFTSGNAVEALAEAVPMRGFRCYCVGEATAALARRLGFDAQAAGATAGDLAETIIADRPAEPCLYLRGEHVSCDLAERLRAAGIAAQEAVVYRQIARPLAAEAREILAGSAPVAVPVFSAMAARLLAAEPGIRAPLYVAAMSDGVAAALAPLRPAMLRVAGAPTLEGVLDELEALCAAAGRLENGRAAP